MKLPKPKATFYIICGLLSILIGFHILVLLAIIPYDMVWGGKLENKGAMYAYETTALIITSIFASILYLRFKALSDGVKNIIFLILNWLIFIYFTFNIFGNLTSGSTLEKIIFTPISISLSLLTLRMALFKNRKTQESGM